MFRGRFTLGFTVLIACSLPAATQAEDFYFSFDAPETVEYDPDFGEAEIVVDVVFEEDEDNEDYPTTVTAVVAVGFDEDVLAISGVELAGPLEDEELGGCISEEDPPCYDFGDGWLLFLVGALSVEKPLPILRITFDTIADELIDDTEGRVTDLVWTIDYGTAEIETFVFELVDGERSIFDLTTTDASIELVPLLGASEFKRGDANGDGEVSKSSTSSTVTVTRYPWSLPRFASPNIVDASLPEPRNGVTD